MNRRYVTSVLALALSACTAGFVHAETPKSNNNVVTAPVTVKGKSVSFHVRNDGSTPLTLQIADQQITVPPGKTADVKAPEGADVTNVNASATRTAGSVITTVSKGLSGNTLAVS